MIPLKMRKLLKLLFLEKRNSGFSLVEIVVALGIFGIVGVGMMGVVGTGATQSKTVTQDLYISAAAANISDAMATAATCNVNPLAGDLQAMARTGQLPQGAGVTIGDSIRVVSALPVINPGDSAVVPARYTVPFNKGDGRIVNRVIRANLVYSVPPGGGAPQLKGCADYEDLATKSAFRANCESIGGTFQELDIADPVDPITGESYRCAINAIDANELFVEAIRKELCQIVLGTGTDADSSYNAGTDRCRDLLLVQGGNANTINASNITPNQVSLGGVQRTSFDQNACDTGIPGDNSFIKSINADGTINCVRVQFDADDIQSGTSDEHCRTDCSCSLTTPGGSNVPGYDYSSHPRNVTVDGGIRYCDTVTNGSPRCAAIGTETSGQYTGSDPLAWRCQGLDCRYLDYFDLNTSVADNTHDDTLTVRLNVSPTPKLASTALTCAAPTLYAQVTAGICAKFNDAGLSALLADYANGSTTSRWRAGDVGLDISQASALKEIGDDSTVCNASGQTGGRCRSGEGVCCSLLFQDDSLGCGNKMRDTCGNLNPSSTPPSFSDLCPASYSCSGRDASGECCKPTYNCDETASTECLGRGGSTQVTCGGGTPYCVSSTCVECGNNSHCANDEYCSSNSCTACYPGTTRFATTEVSCSRPGYVPGTSSQTVNCYGGNEGSCTGGTICESVPAANTVACGTTYTTNCGTDVNGTQCSTGETCNAGSCVPIAGYCTSDSDCTDPPVFNESVGLCESNTCYYYNCSPGSRPSTGPSCDNYMCCESGWRCQRNGVSTFVCLDGPGSIAPR